MKKLWVLILMCLFSFPTCIADTFTNRKTGEVLQGYATQRKRGNTTLVRITDKKKPQYLNLADYDIKWNYLGRRNQVIVLPIKNEIELECETETFEKAIESASNQGPLFILIEIDTPGGRADLTKQICAAITKANNCRTVAFVSGGKYGGAYSAGAFIALACNYIYMAKDTAIGAATPILISPSDVKDLKSAFGETVAEKMMSADRAYIAAIAEQNDRPGLLAKAMLDKDIEVLEVIKDGRTIFTEPKNKKADQSVLRIWSKKGSLLTLTATEAVECGMANKLVVSLEGIISDLGLVNPRIIHNNDAIKARRKFESAKRKFEKICYDIDHYHKKADSIRERINFLTDEYNRLNRGNASNREKLMKEVSAERKRSLSVLSGALKKLISKYKAAIVLSKFHPDLPVDVAVLKKQINSTEVQCEKIKSMY